MRDTDARMRLHLGCGSVILPGWINIDLDPLPGVDRQLDVRDGLPFENVSAIFAEHFIEHLDRDEGAALLRECRRVLAPDGILRLTTPNLDWVWVTSYPSRWTAESATRATIDVEAWKHDEAAVRDCLTINQAFHGWGHRFLYNAATFEEALRRAGFAQLEWCAYGRSAHAELNGLEQHEQSPDTPALPHLLIVEASGVATA
ncbi:MAG TPA: methyltransferase domain-containing protein [Thermoanaerobaculia bacterium]|nr:methyltransferase domain-containing protein [Thermoanaerobaculia bacterium]